MKLEKISFLGKLEKGKLDLNRNYLSWQLSRFEDASIRIIIERIKSKRSLRQNAYYWVCLEVIGNTLGYSAEEMHELFKKMFIPKKFIIYKGREIEVAKTTTKLSKGEFVDYMTKISAEVANLNITLPNPNDYYKNL